MRSARMVALLLMAVTCLCCSLAASASAAEPIFKKIVAVPVKEGEKVAFTSSGTKTTLETVGKKVITCLSASGSGEITGPSSINVNPVFKGCELTATKCTSAGAAEGEILTNGFEGRLGNLKSGSTPGVALSQPAGKTQDAEFTCGTTKVQLFGGVVGLVGGAGKKTARLTLSYSEKAGVQLFESLVMGSLDVLSESFGGAAAEQTGLSGHLTLKFTEEVEVG